VLGASFFFAARREKNPLLELLPVETDEHPTRPLQNGGLSYMRDARVGLVGGGGKRLGTFVFSLKPIRPLSIFIPIQLDYEVKRA